jgi:hypothetical protein
LKEILGELNFYSVHSQEEADFRLLIPASGWEAVKEYCLAHLAKLDDAYLESAPARELSEELLEAVHVDLRIEQYSIHRMGFVIEDPTSLALHDHAGGRPTARIYNLFEVMIIDAALIRRILEANRRTSARDMISLALKGHQNRRKGWINSVLTLPIQLVMEEYLRLPKEARFRTVNIENHWLDASTLAILPEVEVAQYRHCTL